MWYLKTAVWIKKVLYISPITKCKHFLSIFHFIGKDSRGRYSFFMRRRNILRSSSFSKELGVKYFDIIGMVCASIVGFFTSTQETHVREVFDTWTAVEHI